MKAGSDSKFIAGSLLAAIVLSVTPAAYFRGTAVQVLLVAIVVGPALLIGCLSLLIFLHSETAHVRCVSRRCSIVCAILLAPLGSIPIGHALLYIDIREAKAFCKQLEERLVIQMQNTGEVPRHIGVVCSGMPPPPRLIHMNSLYTPHRTSFKLGFSNPGITLGGFVLEHPNGEWRRRD